MVKEAIIEDWEVEKIIAKRGRGKSIRYQVKWKGFGYEENTWEPVSHLESCKEMIENFENGLIRGNTIKKKNHNSTDKAKKIEKPEPAKQKPADLMKNLENYISESDIDHISDVFIGADNEIYGEVIYKNKEKKPGHFNILELNKKYPNLMCDYYYKHISFSYKPRIEFEMKMHK
ncbi:unnamed protein product [Blepharisma stoltei]|uniref:Chromo domain-containing protein n=1 Tax=Blepharisma stoltei TaxID=1481888 RepID=A0AAU9JID2_9CILI|nr:unnamed protein product [Blepharisma stoltei]